jgi:hypothetical protein
MIEHGMDLLELFPVLLQPIVDDGKVLLDIHFRHLLGLSHSSPPVEHKGRGDGT